MFIKGAAAWKHCGALWCPGKWHLILKNYLHWAFLSFSRRFEAQLTNPEAAKFIDFSYQRYLNLLLIRFFYMCVFPKKAGWPGFMFLHQFTSVTSTASDGWYTWVLHSRFECTITPPASRNTLLLSGTRDIMEKVVCQTRITVFIQPCLPCILILISGCLRCFALCTVTASEEEPIR